LTECPISYLSIWIFDGGALVLGGGLAFKFAARVEDGEKAFKI
jgi:hypothetical protein